MTSLKQRDLLIEEVVSAHRPPPALGGLGTHPAWLDLDETDRQRAFAETVRARALEAAADPEGLTTTAHAVLARIRGA